MTTDAERQANAVERIIEREERDEMSEEQINQAGEFASTFADDEAAGYIERLIAALEVSEAERAAALALVAAYKAAGEDVEQACPECEGEGTILVSFAYGGVEIECRDCDATGVAK